MSKTNLVILLVVIVLIMVGLVVINKKTISNNENKIEPIIQSDEVIVNKVTNEAIDEYIVYDKETGIEKTRVKDEHQLKIYEIDPDYEELEVNEQLPINEEINTDDGILEETVTNE